MLILFGYSQQVRRFVGEIVKYLIDGGSGLRPKGDRTV